MSTATATKNGAVTRKAAPVRRTKLETTGAARLTELETTIERGLQTFIEVGQALLEIRDERLYRDDFSSFEAYCKGRWGFTRRRANQIVDAARVGTMVPVENERQARELASLCGSEVKAVWAEAEELAKERNDKITAAVIREAARTNRQRLIAKTKPKPKAERFAMKPARRDWSGWTPSPPRKLPVERIPAAIAAHDRARAASDEIRLVLGPWTTDGGVPEHRRVPESATVEAWRQQLNGNGTGKSRWAKLAAELRKVRDDLADEDRRALDAAIAVLLRCEAGSS